MTYADEQYWKTQGVAAINAEMERRLSEWWERRCGARFCVRWAFRRKESGWCCRVLFLGTRRAAKAFAAAKSRRRDGRMWIDHEDQPARNLTKQGFASLRERVTARRKAGRGYRPLGPVWNEEGAGTFAEGFARRDSAADRE